MKKRVISLIVCIIVLLSTLTSFTACSKPPEYSEIEARFISLVKESYEINKILFGEGLPVYERIYDPWEDMNVKKILDDSGKVESYVYYCYLKDEKLGDILAYRTSYTKPKQYLQVLKQADTSKTPIYVDEATGRYFYEIEYTEPEVDFYYTQRDPENYDYVKPSSPYLTVDAIKEAAEKVYSRDYLEDSVYLALFEGANAGAGVPLESLSARYVEFTDDDSGDTSFMMSNKYPPLITETRQFDFSTAKMVRPSNKKIVSIEVQTYLPSAPEKRLTITVTLVQQDGEWFLDSATY